MCDFSSYGELCAEWHAIEDTTASSAIDQDATTLKESGNSGREAIAAREMISLAAKIEIEDQDLVCRDGHVIQGRTYRPIELEAGGPLYIHFHGGGFLVGTLASEDAICSRIALGTGVVVLNVNYRHTPEHTYPTAWHDAQDAFAWAHSNIHHLKVDPYRIVVGGISAGAWLAASLTLAQHLGEWHSQSPKIVGQILMIPALVYKDCYAPQLAQISSPDKSSYEQNKNAPILPAKRAEFFSALLQVTNARENDLLLNPGNVDSQLVKGLAPTVFGIAGADPLRDEGLLFAKKLTESGVPTDISVFPGLPHGFRRYGSQLQASQRWDEVMNQGILWTLSNPLAIGFIIKEA